jgi:hypothetical protein
MYSLWSIILVVVLNQIWNKKNYNKYYGSEGILGFIKKINLLLPLTLINWCWLMDVLYTKLRTSVTTITGQRGHFLLNELIKTQFEFTVSSRKNAYNCFIKKQWESRNAIKWKETYPGLAFPLNSQLDVFSQAGNLMVYIFQHIWLM